MAYRVEDVLIVVILLYYISATALFAFWSNRASQKPDNDDDNNGVDSKKEEEPEDTKTPKWPTLRKVQLTFSLLIVALCITRSALRGVSVGRISKEGDPTLIYDLFFTLVWVFLTLGLFDFSEGPRFPHYGSWLLCLLSQIVTLTKHLTRSGTRTRYFLADALLQGVCAAVIVALLCGTLLVEYTRKEEIADTNAEETRPLLAEETPEDQKKKDNKAKELTEVEKARKELRNRPFWIYISSFKVYIPYMLPSSIQQRGYFIVVCICTGISRVINIARPLALGALINHILPNYSVPWKYVSLYIFLYYLDSAAGISLLQEFAKYRLTNEQKLALNRAAYNHIMTLSADFHDSKKSSHIWQAIFQGRSVISLFHDMLFSLTPSFIDLFAAISVLWALFGPYMGFIVATTVVVFIWMTVKSLSSKADLQRDYTEAWHEEIDQLIDSSYHWKTVVEFGQIPYEIERFRTKGKTTQKAQEKITYFEYITRGARYAVLVLAFVAACCLAVIEISHGDREIGDFVVLTSYWSGMVGPLSSLVSEVNATTNKLVDAEKLLILLERKPTVKDDKDAETFDFRGGDIEFNNVTFSYDGKRDVSDSISFRVPAGTTTALVGETGGGKSTLFKLLYRFYDVKTGTITIDGQNVKNIKMESFRKHIGIVPQDPALFYTSVLENVRYPDPSLTTDEIYDVCKAVALHDKILTFSKGYEEKVGERGIRLSGGELQRLAIARAILKKPDILLLDEATSSVDSVTEAQIQASLDLLCKGKTTFVIAHRLSTILRADQILVIKGGKLVEAGTHAELLKKEGAYHTLWSSQLKLQGDLEKASKDSEKKGGLTLVNDLRGSEEEAQKLTQSTIEKTPIVEVVEASSSGTVSPTKDQSPKADTRVAHNHKQSAHDKSHSTSRDRGRSPVKQVVDSFERRLSSSKSPGQSGKVSKPITSTQSPTRLSATAAPFVPQTVQRDGAADEQQTPLLANTTFTTQGGTRKTQSEPVMDGNESDESKSDSQDDQLNNRNSEQNGGKYSRIPQRKQ